MEIFVLSSLLSPEWGIGILFKMCGELLSDPKCYVISSNFLSLVKVNSENLALKDNSSFDLPRYDCILFMSLILLNGEYCAVKNV